MANTYVSFGYHRQGVPIEMRGKAIFLDTGKTASIDGGATPTANLIRLRTAGGTDFTCTNGSQATRPLTIPAASSINIPESASAPAALANTAKLYALDNGSGKTLARARFGTGAEQTFATEP